MSEIPIIGFPHGHLSSGREDPSRYLIKPNQFHRPYLKTPNGSKFVWPVGTEGFRFSDSATLGIHQYIGEDDIEASVIYRSLPRIEMSGSFPGHTGRDNMNALRRVVKERGPKSGKLLYLPGIFGTVLLVVVESAEFTHDADDRTRSFGYSITFLKIGAGRRIRPGQPDPPQQNPAPNRFFKVKAGYRTLRKIAGKVYQNSDKWNRIYNLNEKKLEELDIPRHKLPTKRLPLGMRLRW